MNEQGMESDFPWRFVGVSLVGGLVGICAGSILGLLFIPLGLAWSLARVLWEVNEERRMGFRS